MRKQEFSIKIQLNKVAVVWLWIIAAALLDPVRISTQFLQIDTYYPSPPAIYTTLEISEGAQLAFKDGNLGIGVLAPTDKIDVDGNVRIRGGLKTNNGIVEVGDFSSLPLSDGPGHFIRTASGDLVLDSGTGRIRIGLSPDEYFANMCRSEWYEVLSSGIDTCNANGGQGWLAVAFADNAAGQLTSVSTGNAAGYMICCKISCIDTLGGECIE